MRPEGGSCLDDNASSGSEETSIIRIAELVAGYFASVVVLIYPIGVAVLGLQLWTAYGYPLPESLYAAALAPVATAVVPVFYFLYWFLAPLGSAGMISELVQGPSYPLRMPRSQRLMEMLCVVLVLMAPILVLPEYILSLRGITLWVGFVLATCVGGLLSGLLRRREESRWQRLSATAIIYLFAIVAAVLLTGTEGPSLPLVEFGAGDRTEARLLSHSGGYWYFFDAKDGLSAVPDDEAGASGSFGSKLYSPTF